MRSAVRRLPLRVKLVAILLVLVIAALVGSGLVAAATLRGYLVGRVDDDLRAAQRSLVQRQGDLDDDGGRPGPTGRGRLPSNFVVAITDAAGNVVFGPASQLVDADEPLPQLPHPTAAQTVARGAATFTVDAVRGDAQWRVYSGPVTLADGTAGTLLVAQSLGPVDSTIRHLEVLSLVIGAVTVVVLAGVGYLVVRASLRPLRAVERSAARIAAGDLSHRVPEADARTEVGGVANALNMMLGEIETAFAQRAASEQAARSSEEQMRRFVADASHELRTPLTTIRGFAELYRQGAVRDEAAVRRVLGRIEAEAQRMGVLVDDLLLLARLDEQRPLERAPVDLLGVAADAVESARAVAPDRPIGLEVGRTDPPPVVIGDEARLRQVLGNLVTNALKHTPARTPVTVRVGTSAGPDRAVLEVVDQGPGLTAEDAAHVFERFYRVDKARTTAPATDGGSGLGLAIVSALVAGHGGRVSVTTAPGQGATFRVELPLAGLPAHAVAGG